MIDIESELIPCLCGRWCEYQRDSEPCWGAVRPVDTIPPEGESIGALERWHRRWKHACAGHAIRINGDPMARLYQRRPEGDE